MLLQYIHVYCSEIKNTPRNYLYQPFVTENMYYVINILYQIIQTDILTNQKSVGAAVADKLQNEVLGLYKIEPLLCEYIWNVITLIRSNTQEL